MTVTSLLLCGICLVTNLVSYGFFMDDYYYVSPGIFRTLSIIIEILLMICLTFITTWHLMGGLCELVQKKLRVLVTVISVFITINGLWNAVFSLILMTGTLSPPRDLAMDPTGFFLLIINLFTVLLIYQEDFFALFRIEDGGPEALASNAAGHGQTHNFFRQSESADRTVETAAQGEPEETEEKEIAGQALESGEALEDLTKYPSQDPDKNRLDFIAQSHSLTQREREVLELAYRGMTNPEIADELIISKYTVKRHMHNIFEKLDISTRMELVHLIGGLNRRENGPGGPL